MWLRDFPRIFTDVASFSAQGRSPRGVPGMAMPGLPVECGGNRFFNHNKNMILNCYLYGVLRSMVSRSVRCYNDAVPPVSAAHNDVRLGRRTYNITRETQIS